MSGKIQIRIIAYEFVSILTILLELLLESNNTNKELLIFAGLFCMGQIIFIVWNQKKNALLFLSSLFIVYFLYSVVVRVYLQVDDLPYIFRYTAVTRMELLRSAVIVQIFFCVYVYTIKSGSEINQNVFKESGRCNKHIVWTCALMCLLSPFLFYDASNGYGKRGSISSPLYEYTCLFVLIGMMYSGRKKKNLFALAMASGFWCLHGLAYGERAPALTVVIIWGCYLILPRITSGLILLCSIAGITLFSLVGSFRGISNFSLAGIQEALEGMLTERFASDTAYYAYQAGNAIVRFESYNSMLERIRYGLGYIKYIFAGGRVQAGNLSMIVQNNPGTFHQGGGWIMFYAHFWGGAAAVFLVGAYVAFIINKSFALKSSNETYWNYLALYIVGTVPRWFLYSPAQITRGVFIYSIVYGFFYLIYRFTTKSVKQRI